VESESPTLYVAESKLYDKNGALQDVQTTRFGIRTISYTAGEGFKLNGQVTKFRGVCLHHDLGPLGAAVNKAALRRQIQMMKDMGANAIRSSHNMPSMEQLELCDEMGMLFLAESFDEWKKPKVKNGYNRFFDEYHEKDIVNLVRATRNHPCIVMWSSGNEVPDQWGSEGVKRAKMLQEIFHREDPTRPGYRWFGPGKSGNGISFGAIMDVPGLNYRTHLYRKLTTASRRFMCWAPKTASTVSSRCIYKFPVEKAVGKMYDDGQCSSYDLEFCNWSNLPEDDAVLQDDKDWVIGEFVWTGFDTWGEPTPYDEYWPSRSSYFGIATWPACQKTVITGTKAAGIPQNQPCICCRIGTGKAWKETLFRCLSTPVTPAPSCL
jgi:beta-galactosidase